MRKKEKKIVFYFPWKEVSGGPYYLTGIANEIAEKKEYDVYYTDYYNGISDELLIPSVKKIEFTKFRDFEVFPNEPVILIIPIYFLHALPVMNKDSKIIFVNWHTLCIEQIKKDAKLYGDKLTDFLKMVSDNNCTMFGDKSHWRSQSSYGVEFKNNYVPVVTTQKNLFAPHELVSKEKNISILGRVSLDKVYAYIDLIHNIEKAYPDDNQINIHIIGEGKYEPLISQESFNDNINIIRHGTLPLDEAMRVIVYKSDALFAMGKSILEGASVGIPSVIIPNKDERFQCDKYVYIYDTKEYCLGWDPDEIDILELKTHSVKEIIDSIYVYGKKKEIADKCYNYFLENHTTNSDALLEIIKQSSMYYSQLSEFIERNVPADAKLCNHKQLPLVIRKIQKILKRIKEVIGTRHKQVSLLGIPIFTITKTDPINYNVFLFIIPLFRCITNNKSKSYSFHILPIYWIYKFFRGIFRFIKKKSA